MHWRGRVAVDFVYFFANFWLSEPHYSIYNYITQWMGLPVGVILGIHLILNDHKMLMLEKSSSFLAWSDQGTAVSFIPSFDILGSQNIAYSKFRPTW